MGLTYGPLGTVLSELFPTSVRYTGSSLTFNFGGDFRCLAGPLHRHVARGEYGLQSVGYYLLVAALVSLACIFASGKTEV